jgi:hypothetical protein
MYFVYSDFLTFIYKQYGAEIDLWFTAGDQCEGIAIGQIKETESIESQQLEILLLEHQLCRVHSIDIDSRGENEQINGIHT